MSEDQIAVVVSAKPPTVNWRQSKLRNLLTDRMFSKFVAVFLREMANDRLSK